MSCHIGPVLIMIYRFADTYYDLVTKGHGVRPDETWFAISTDWLRVFVGDSVNITSVNGAIPGMSQAPQNSI